MKKPNNVTTAHWILRIAVAGEFFGHGMFALQAKEGWIPFFTPFGFSPEQAIFIMPIIGAMDIFFALLVLVKPIRVALLWMAFWGLWTALLRPLTGGPFWDFVERWPNWGAPLALLYLRGIPKKSREWLR